MGFVIPDVSESSRFFVGLDLGQMRDHSALAVVERDEIFVGEMDHATYERPRVRRFRVRYLERLALGTSYPTVVERVRQVVRQRPLMSRCTLIMDATGVGTPVLDLMRQANLGCGIVPVNLTGGDLVSQSGSLWNVPKQVLISGLLVMLEKKELALSMRVASARVLHLELAGMEAAGEPLGTVELWNVAGGRARRCGDGDGDGLLAGAVEVGEDLGDQEPGA